MNFRFSEDEEAFRQEIRAYIREHLTPEVIAQNHVGHPTGPAARAFVQTMAERGWLTRSWPVEHGGEGKHPLNFFILAEELHYAHAPGLTNGLAQVGPTLIRHGTPFQQRFFLPRIKDGSLQFGLGYSEPEAGSDLASLQLRAERDGDDYVLNGQKRFTTSAHYADYMWLAARTDPHVPKHRGISLFLVDMTLPGITHRPLWCLGTERTNEVYYDNVRVPATFLVGGENRGWYVISESLDYERSYQMPSGPMRRELDELLAWARTAARDGVPVRRDPHLRHTVARLAIETEVVQMHTFRIVDAALHGRVPNVEGAMNKLWASHLEQRFGHLGVDLQGLYGQLKPGSPHAEAGGYFEQLVEETVVRTIYGGSSEVQKNIIAKRHLGLPG